MIHVRNYMCMDFLASSRKRSKKNLDSVVIYIRHFMGQGLGSVYRVQASTAIEFTGYVKLLRHLRGRTEDHYHQWLLFTDSFVMNVYKQMWTDCKRFVYIIWQKYSTSDVGGCETFLSVRGKCPRIGLSSAARTKYIGLPSQSKCRIVSPCYKGYNSFKTCKIYHKVWVCWIEKFEKIS